MLRQGEVALPRLPAVSSRGLSPHSSSVRQKYVGGTLIRKLLNNGQIYWQERQLKILYLNLYFGSGPAVKYIR